MSGILLTLVLMAPGIGVDGGPTVVGSKFELFVTDVAESARFYEALGFVVVQRKPDGYTTLRCGQAVVALSPWPAWLPLRWLGFLRLPPIGTEIVFYTGRLEAVRSDLLAAGYDPGPIELQSWGDRDFRVRDHDGYYVRVSEGQAVPAPSTRWPLVGRVAPAPPLRHILSH